VPAPPSTLAPPAALPRAGDRPAPRTLWERVAAASWDFYRSTVSVLRFELLPFLAWGLFAARGRPGWRGCFVGGISLAYAAVLAALALSAGYVSRRHALPPLVPLLGYAASGLALAAGWSAERITRWRPRLRGVEGWVAALWIAGLLGVMWGPVDLSARRLDRLAVRRAGEWVRQAGLRDGPVAAGRLRVAYYADRPFVPLPSAPPGGMLHYLEARGVRFVIVDDSKLGAHQGLREVRDTHLRLLHRETAGGRTASVYEVPESPADSRPSGATPRTRGSDGRANPAGGPVGAAPGARG
jgi:hypothetical protein